MCSKVYKVKCGTRAAITYQDELRVVSNQYLAGWRVECIFPVFPERKRENKTRRVCILIPIMSSPFAKKKEEKHRDKHSNTTVMAPLAYNNNTAAFEALSHTYGSVSTTLTRLCKYTSNTSVWLTSTPSPSQSHHTQKTLHLTTSTVLLSY